MKLWRLAFGFLLLGAAVAFAPIARAQESSTLSDLSLVAHLEDEKTPITSGLVWRLYADPTDGTPARFVTDSSEASPTLKLQPGAYIIHVTYGFSGTTRRVVLGAQPLREDVIISAGALTLAATLSDTPIPADRVSFSIYVAVGTDPEGRLIVDNIKPNVVVRLPVGVYRIVSRYGDTNAIASYDIKVEPGKLIDVTLRHRAATVTLKLVNKLGGDAYAGTTFSVLTPGGDTIRDLVGAFPSLILAEGEYILIARNGGRIFTEEFKVRSGFDQDIEILDR
ncbi:MAG: hypothetical protein FJX04_10065 [Alphaproteobacteria bacterium]|nr:hypothetical protein [Alphaproteobacteria bacterium]